MNEKKKLYIILGVVLSIIIFIIAMNVIAEIDSNKVIKKFDQTLETSERQMIVIGREGCSYCQMFIPLLEYMSKQNNFEYHYVDTNKITSSGLKHVLKKLSINSSDFGTPHLSIVENGEIIDELAGYVDEKELLEFLKKNSYAAEDTTLPLNYLNSETYKKVLESSTPQVIVIGQTSCSYCMMMKPVILNVANKNNIKINYLNMTELTEEEKTNLYSSLPYLSENEWGTPLTLVVKNSEVLAVQNGYATEDNYVNFLKTNKVIGE